MQLFDLLSNQLKKMYFANGLQALFFSSIEYYINLNLLRDGSFAFLCELVDHLLRSKKRHLIRCLILGFNPEKLKSDDLFMKCLGHNLLTPLIYMAIFSTDQFVLEPLLFLKKYILDNQIVKLGDFDFQREGVADSIGADLMGDSGAALLFVPHHSNRLGSSLKSLPEASDGDLLDSPMRKGFNSTLKEGLSQKGFASGDVRAGLERGGPAWQYSEVGESDQVEMIFTWYVYSFARGSILGQPIKRFDQFFLIFIDHLFQDEVIRLLFSIDWKTSLLIYQACIHPQKKHLFFTINWNHYSVIFANSLKNCSSALHRSQASEPNSRSPGSSLGGRVSGSSHVENKSNRSKSDAPRPSPTMDRPTSIEQSRQRECSPDNPLEPGAGAQLHSRMDSMEVVLHHINDDTLQNLASEHNVPQIDPQNSVRKRLVHSKTQESKNADKERHTASRTEQHIGQKNCPRLDRPHEQSRNKSERPKDPNREKVKLVNAILEDRDQFELVDADRAEQGNVEGLISKTSVHFMQLLHHFTSNLMFIPDAEYFEFIMTYLSGVFLNSQCFYFDRAEYFCVLDSFLTSMLGFLSRKHFVLKEAISLLSEIIQNNFDFLRVPEVPGQ